MEVTASIAGTGSTSSDRQADTILSCKHAAAVGYLFAEELARQPLLALTLLGMPADRLLDRLRRHRALQSQGTSSAHGEAMVPESQLDVPPLEACLDDFWRGPGGGDLSHVENQPPLQHVPHALLRRLGPSPLNGRFPMVGLLASVYDVVSVAARRLRDDTDQT